MPRGAPKTATHCRIAPSASEKKQRSEDETVSLGGKKKNGGPQHQHFNPTEIGANGQLLCCGKEQWGT